MKPSRPINTLGRADWRYRDSKHTSLRDTFARERRRIKEQAERDAQSPKVALIKRAKS